VTDNGKPSTPPRPRTTTMDEYNAKQEAERAKTVRLRELRLAAEARAAGKPEPKVKRKPRGKTK
jgi:hypothetical protein